ncbi:hypothetical protein PHMEG_00024081 [Phytophthora megakarya]|uniref:Eukaryotic/viral aspartic protease n=1 Tax=Phytophthora megakarya TaxID=4795 RepID=A0A225VEW0_9STRA|nr:hypothetical protein PHMEG_00024081 [Phytophthora megakarya]
MVKPKRTQKEGREGDGQEVEGLRRSRRVDGQEPEEQKPLEVIEKEAKALRKAKREAREAEKAAAAAQPVVEPAAEGRPCGGVNLVESPTSEEKEVVPEPTPSVEVVEILTEDSDSEEKAPVKTEPIEHLESRTSTSKQWRKPTWRSQFGDGNISSGRVTPLSPAYAWPASTPDYTAWLEAAKTTSDFLTQQATLGSQDAMWIADLNSTRLGFGTAQDLLGVQILTAFCEARQYAALLQTLLFEAGFPFDAVIPEWFRTRASKISADQSHPKKAKEQSDPPPDDPDDSEPSDSDNDASRGGDSDSSDAEGFSSEEEDIGMTTTTTTAEGTTIWNCRPYIGYTNLEKFDEKASRDNRVNWWERFSDMASHGSWSDAMKIRQFRSRMSTAIRDWFTQLPTSTRHDWKQMSRRFRKLYIGTTGSYSERYFTMKVTDHPIAVLLSAECGCSQG